MSIGAGLAAGYLFSVLARHLKPLTDRPSLIFGFILLSVGISQWLGTSLILTCMVLGMFLASTAMGAVVWCLVSALGPFFAPERGLLIQVLALGAVIVSGVLTYLLAGTLAGALKPRALLKDLLGR